MDSLTINITENGTITRDVTEYEAVEIAVNVSNSGPTVEDVITRAWPTGAIETVWDIIPAYRFDGNKVITSVRAPNALTLREHAFYEASNIESVYFPKVTTVQWNSLRTGSKLQYLVLPSCDRVYSYAFGGQTALLGADFGGTPTSNKGFLENNIFNGCSKMNVLILRGESVWPLVANGVFTNTPFASGKAGGTIYIPKVLYDHLGDESEYDYLSVANWATLNGYGTVTWAPIEGSIYETQYIDGTPIRSSAPIKKTIEITENGTTTVDVSECTDIEIVVNVPNSGHTIDEYIARSWPVGAIETQATTIYKEEFRDQGITSVTGINITSLGAEAFCNCTGLTSIWLPNLEALSASCFKNASFKYAILPSLKKTEYYSWTTNPKLIAVDFGGSPTSTQGFYAGGNTFTSCTNLEIIVLRGTTIWPLGNVNNFTNTPFASGKAGGTIYIRKELYDHLGDGSEYDYLAQTNWATVNGYGTITWAAIEGSIYENQYVDGTQIQTTSR